MSNCSPKKDIITRTKYLNRCTGTVVLENGFCSVTSGAGDGAATYNLTHLQFSYIRKAWHEIRPPSSDNKTIVNGSKKPKIIDVGVKVPIGEDQDGDTIFGTQYYKQQEYSYDQQTGQSVPVYEKECQADVAYDEKYFYHIFEWPISFAITPRNAGGFISSTVTATGGAGDGASTTTTTTYSTVSTSVSAQLTLAKVDSQIEGVPEGSAIYHGGTDSNAIFFQYLSTSKTVLAAGDTINGWTVSKVVNYNAVHSNDTTFYITKSVRKRISKRSKKNREPSYVYINNNESKTNKKRRESDSNDTLIDIVNPGDRVSGSKGIRPGTTVVSVEGNKVNLSKPLGKGKVKEIKFSSNEATNSQNDGTLCYAELTGSGGNFVADGLYDINSSSGPQSTIAAVNHIFNDDRNINVDLVPTGPINVQAKSLTDSGGSNSSDSRKHYLITFTDATVINNINDINIQVLQNLTASGITNTLSVSKIELVNDKSFKIWFVTNTGDNSFARSWTVSVGGTTTGNQLRVVAGKGIINRSAVVGTYISNDKKLFVYTPLLYKTDEECDSTKYDDNNAQYVLGDIVLNDESEYVSDEWLCIKPETNLAYDINNIYWNLFNRPVDKPKLEYWISQYKNDIPELKTKILISEQQELNGRLITKVISSECGDPIDKDYTKVYYPYDEIKTFDDLIRPLSSGIGEDPCVDIQSAPAYTEEELKNTISKNIEGNFNISGITVPTEMYKKLVTDENSLQNMLLRAVRTVASSVPTDTRIPNLPPQIEAEDNSNISHIANSANRLPPRIKRIQYFIDDMSLVSDVELSPGEESNNIQIKIKSIPRWNSITTVDSVNGDDVSPGNGLRIVSNKTNGYLNNIQVLPGAFPPPPGIVIPGFTPAVPTVSWIQDTEQTQDGNYVGGPWPDYIWHGAGVNYQQEFEKVLTFRINEVSEYVSDAVKNKGNPFQDNPECAKIMKNITPSDTTIVVDSTAGFTSAGYLMIPKFIIKTEVNPETKSESKKFYYLGEEIIYYKRKTETEFKQCVRGMLETSPDFETSVSTAEIDSGVYYIIKTLGNTNWQNYGAPNGATIGTIFQATKDGIGSTETGEATLFESVNVPFDSSPVINAVLNSYEKRNYVVQYWPVKIQDKDVI